MGIRLTGIRFLLLFLVPTAAAHAQSDATIAKLIKNEMKLAEWKRYSEQVEEERQQHYQQPVQQPVQQQSIYQLQPVQYQLVPQPCEQCMYQQPMYQQSPMYQQQQPMMQPYRMQMGGSNRPFGGGGGRSCSGRT